MLEWILIIIGILTIFFVILNMFTKYGDETPPPSINIPLSLEKIGDFTEILASTVNSSVDISHPVKILTDGKEFLPDLLAEIEKAKRSIYITNFICEDGEFGKSLMDALAVKAKEGVQVRVLLDGFGSIYMSKKLTEKLIKNGGKVAFFRPITWWNFDRINRRIHVRDYVIDNRIVYLGGIAIADSWLCKKPAPDQWHDFMYKGSGKMAEKGNKIFINIWSQTTGEYLTPSKQAKQKIESEEKSRFVSLFSSPSPDLSSNLENFMWLSITAAKKSIRIQNPYLLPSDAILKALEKKARSGVKVEIIVPGKNTDTYHTRWASHTFYSSLLKAGIKIYEYKPSRMHAKVVVIDGIWSVIGSANLDNRSSKINLEWIVGIHDKQLGQEIEEKFTIDKSQSKEITKTFWSKTGYLMVPVQYFARLFSQLY